jgi:hypothetical protein
MIVDRRFQLITGNAGVAPAHRGSPDPEGEPHSLSAKGAKYNSQGQA